MVHAGNALNGISKKGTVHEISRDDPNLMTGMSE